MTTIYKTAEGEHLVRERYLAFLKYWPVANEHVRIATSQGETFVVACGDVNAPPLLLLHGSAGNSVMWLGDIAASGSSFFSHQADARRQRAAAACGSRRSSSARRTSRNSRW